VVTVLPSRPLWRGRALALVGIVLFAFSLRSAVASLSPVLDHIRGDFDVPAWIVGTIGTAPPVCYAIAGLLTPRIERRLGLERFTVVALLVVTAGLVARGLATDAVMLALATAVIFAGVGAGNILLPPLVKKYFPDRIGLVTTFYSTTMALSTMLPPLFAVPVADAAGWRMSLALWALFSALAVLPWIALMLRVRAERAAADALEPVDTALLGRLWRLPLAWSLMTIFLVSGAIAYTAFAWLPSMLIDLAGVSPAQAGTLLSLFAMMGLPASLVVPVLVARFRAVPALFAVAVVAGLSGLAGFLFAPAAAPWLWVVLLGTAPLFFPLSLVLIGLRARTHEGALVLSGFVQSIGYAGVAFVPLAVGIMHDLSESWTGPLVLLAVVLLAAIPAGFQVARPHTIEDEWERRHGRSW
jgi:CP family cyanate transporter-like MFS transporter